MAQDNSALAGLLNKHVRVHLNNNGGIHAEGRVIGIIFEPSLVIEQADGTHKAVASSLRREILLDPLPDALQPHHPIHPAVRALLDDALAEVDNGHEVDPGTLTDMVLRIIAPYWEG